MMNKSEIRKQIKILKNKLNDTRKLELSKDALLKLESLSEFKSAQNIGLYHSLNDEVFTHSFIDKWSSFKNIFLPRIIGNDLEMVKYIRNENMDNGKYNICEPINDEVESLDNLDLIIVPAVALSDTGQRIGRGKGYYDRLLNGSNILKIGLVYDFQICPSFEPEPHDIPVDIIVTDSRILFLNK